MIRNFLAVVAGLSAGMVVNMAIVTLNSTLLFPMPEGTDFNDPVAFGAYVASLPVAALLVAMLAHLGQAFVGGWVAARLAASRPMVLALLIGGLSLLGGIANAMQIPTPTWFYVEFPLYLVVAWLAGTIEVKRRARAVQQPG